MGEPCTSLPATCANGKCRALGACVDTLAVVEGPSTVADYVSDRVFDGTRPLSPHRVKYLHELADARRAEWKRAAAARPLIAFTGLAGSGKSTAAIHLVKTGGYTRLRFAGPLKAMMAALGLSYAEIDGDRKEVPCDLLCGRTPRHAMQTIGKEWGRDLIGPDLWVRAWRASFDRAIGPVVVDDCRFPNEADAVLAAGGIIVRVDRPGAGQGAAGHSSEGQPLPHTFTIQNTGSLPEFLSQVDVLRRDMTQAVPTP